MGYIDFCSGCYDFNHTTSMPFNLVAISLFCFRYRSQRTRSKFLTSLSFRLFNYFPTQNASFLTISNIPYHLIIPNNCLSNSLNFILLPLFAYLSSKYIWIITSQYLSTVEKNQTETWFRQRRVIMLHIMNLNPVKIIQRHHSSGKNTVNLRVYYKRIHQ